MPEVWRSSACSSCTWGWGGRSLMAPTPAAPCRGTLRRTVRTPGGSVHCAAVRGHDRKVNKDLGVALWRVVVRAVILLILGTALTMLGTPVSVILAYYAVFFVFACMLLTERWTVIAGAAATLGFIGPIVSFWIRSRIDRGGTMARIVETVNAYDPLVALADDGVVNFLLTGSYPAITWLPFVFAGLAIGRLDLRQPRVRWRLVAVGAGMAAAAYTLSWLAIRGLGLDERLAATLDPDTGIPFGIDGFNQLYAEGMGAPCPPPTGRGCW